MRTGAEGMEALAAAAPMLTIDVPNATLAGVPSRADWAAGPFESMRATRYRTAAGCGLRLRLQPRLAGNWHLVSGASGAVVTLDSLSLSASAETATVQQKPTAGALVMNTTLSQSRSGGAGAKTPAAGIASAGFAQMLPSGATLRGFVSGVKPTTVGAPFAGVGISSLQLGTVAADAAVGDLFVNVGDTGDGELPSITSSVFRGAGAAFSMSDALSVQVFGGRGAEASLSRIGTDGTFAPRSRQWVGGGQAMWIPPLGNYSAAAGAVHTSTPGGGARTLNLFQAVEYRRTPVLRIRVITEESRAFDSGANGFAYTLQPRVAMRDFSVEGFYRGLSSQFRPAGGSGFYAALRRSYGLSAQYEREPFAVSAAASQAKVFNVFDPENVGSLTASFNASASYAVSKALSFNTSYGESSIRSDPGARIPADSRSRQAGAGLALSSSKFGVLTQFSASSTENEIDPRLDLVSRRVDVDVNSGYWRSIYGRFSIAHSQRRDGTDAGSDYRAMVGAPLFNGGGWGVTGEGGVEVTPAGVTQDAVRIGYASVHISPPQHAWLGGGLQLSVQRVSTGAERFTVFFASVNAQQMLRWGEAFIVPQYETRALHLGANQQRRAAGGSVRVLVFVDENNNGRFDPEEKPVTPAFVEIAGRRYKTDSRGEIRAQVTPGEQTARLLPRGATIGWVVPATTAKVNVEAGGSAEVKFPLRPAGRLVGRIEAQGAIPPNALSGIYFHIKGPVERQSFTDSTLTFDFGLLPEGEYEVSIDPDSLRERQLAAVPPAQVKVQIKRGTRESATFRVRRMTARERFGT